MLQDNPSIQDLLGFGDIGIYEYVADPHQIDLKRTWFVVLRVL